MRSVWFAVVGLMIPALAHAYPTDEWERTGISRLKWQYEVDFKGRRGRKMVTGGRWPGRQIQLKMMGEGRNYDLTPETPKDPQLQEALEQILKKWSWRRYNVAILDITDPANPRFAGVNEHAQQTPGSVAKVLTAAGMFAGLEARFPEDIAKREELLRSHKVSADDWALSDSHEVPVIYGENGEKVAHRRIRTGDTFTLWEWMDHALSASNNSAASTLWREATLMKLMGDEYPPAEYGPELFARWDKEQWSEASFAVVNEPLIAVGMDPEVFRLRLYFTRGANRYIKSKSCGATPFSLARWLLKVEQGKMVDEFSSRELKKMLYLTRRRVRYLYTKKLHDYGAFFKSGSLYRFSPNAERIQYRGDIINVLNSLIEIDTSAPLPVIVESEDAADKEEGTKDDQSPAEKSVPVPDAVTEPAPTVEAAAPDAAKEKPYVYIVAVMSNELKRNAALDHSKLAEAVHEAIIAPRKPAPAPSDSAAETPPEKPNP